MIANINAKAVSDGWTAVTKPQENEYKAIFKENLTLLIELLTDSDIVSFTGD